jgi:hypothetical protein
LCKTLFQSHKLFAEASELLMHFVFQLLVIVCKTASSEGQKDGSWSMINWNYREDEA